jgi:uncharacterized protein
MVIIDKEKAKDIKKHTDYPQLHAIAEKIKSCFNPIKIILFGSHAYGKSTLTSDLDLFVIMKTNLKFHKQAALIRLKLDETVGVLCPMDIIVRTPDVVEKRLKEGDFFIRTVLEKGVEL